MAGGVSADEDGICGADAERACRHARPVEQGSLTGNSIHRARWRLMTASVPLGQNARGPSSGQPVCGAEVVGFPPRVRCERNHSTCTSRRPAVGVLRTANSLTKLNGIRCNLAHSYLPRSAPPKSRNARKRKTLGFSDKSRHRYARCTRCEVATSTWARRRSDPVVSSSAGNGEQRRCIGALGTEAVFGSKFARSL